MGRVGLLGCVVTLLTAPLSADEEIFSGPQPGEKLPAFSAKGVFGDQAGQELDLVKTAGDKPLLLIFVHERTRPAFGLTNRMMKFAASRAEAGLHSGVIFLTDDATETEKWMRVVEANFPKGVTYAISTDGAEGPGAYGLNRNVSLTVLVGKGGEVTANFALVQPGLATDGPAILKAIVAVAGGKVPTIAELTGDTRPPARRTDERLSGLLRSLINRQATPEAVQTTAAEIEQYVAGNEAARKELGRISSTVVNSGKLADYGTEPAQKILQEWAKKYAPPTRERKPE